MNGHKILVAQNDPVLAAEVSSILTGAGYTVAPTVSESGQLAVAVAHHQPDLLLVDLDLPGGWENAALPVPVVYLSASPSHPGPLVLKPVRGHELTTVVELTLRNEALERQLRERESELRTLIANVPGAVYRCELRPPWRMSYFSDHPLNLTGRPAAELISGQTSWADLIVPEDLAEVSRVVETAVANRQAFQCEYRIRHLDGEIRWVQESGRCVEHPDGTPSHIDGVILDISARKLSEDARERERIELAAIYDQAPVMLCVLDSERHFLYANRAFAEMAGQDNDELRGQSVCEVLYCASDSNHPHCLICEALTETLRTGDAQRDIEFQAMVGSRSLHLLASTALIPAAGAPRLLLCLSDVTATESSRHALSRSEEKYRALIENAGQAVLVVQAGIVQFVNAAAETLMGESRQALLQRPVTDLIHPDDLQMVLERHQARSAGLAALPSYTFRVLRAPEGFRWAHLDAVQIEWNGQPATLSFLSDITHQVQLESDYATLFYSMQEGFAVHELILDSQGRPIDYRFIAVNPAFEQMTGLEAGQIVGRNATEVLLGLEPHWLATYAEVVQTGVPARFENHTAPLDKWFEVYAYRPREGQFACVIEDITERKQMQETLVFLAECGYTASGESFFQSLARYLADKLDMDFVCIDRLLGDGLQAQTVAVYCNGEFLDNIVYGLRDTPCGDVVGKSICCFPRDVRKLFPNDPALEDLRAESYAGTTLWSFDGKPVGLIAVISRKPLLNSKFVESVLQMVAVRAAGELERERAELAMRESEELHRTILNASPDDISITDLQGRIRMVSHKGLAMFRADQLDELLGRPLTDFVVPEDRQRAIDNTRLMIEGGGRRGEFLALRCDGTVFDIEVNGEVIRGADGSPSSLLFVVRDITERKRVEAALRASEDQYRTLIHNLSAGVVVHGPDSQILLANPTAARILGITRDAMQGKLPVDPVWRFVHGDGSPMPLESFPVVRVLQTGRPVNQLLVGMVRSDRIEPTWTLVDAYPVLNDEGSVAQVVVTFLDITERRIAEARLVHAQKMESIGRLAGGIAHDFNNLLTVINGYSLLMMDKVPSLDPLRSDLEAILRAGERAAVLTGKILAFSRKQLLQPRVFDLNLAVKELRPMLMRLVGEDVEITVNTAAEPLFVNADPHQLEQVVMNLVVNGRDAMPLGGKLVIGVAAAEWNAELAREYPEASPGDYVLLSVADNGGGMDAQTRQRIFEPFFTTKGVGQGTGLGLSMAQGIVAQSGGFIAVQSELGRGATFQVGLPRVADPRASELPSGKPRAPGGTESILLVEDQADVRHLAAYALHSYGYNVTSASSAVEALARFEETSGSFDLLLTDVVMPGLSGRELADRLLEQCPGLKVLFMSGYTGDIVMRHGVDGEDSAFIEKPFTPDQLAARVRAVLSPV